MTFGECLGVFKRQENPANLAALINDAALQRALMAWPSTPVTYVLPAPDLDVQLSPLDQWNALWDCVRFDDCAFVGATGLPRPDALRLFVRLKGLKLIYPDGSINETASQFLKALVMGTMSKARPQVRKAPQEKS